MPKQVVIFTDVYVFLKHGQKNIKLYIFYIISQEKT